MKHIGEQVFDYVVVNNGFIDQERLDRYLQELAVPVAPSVPELQKLGIEVIEADLVSDTEVAWHDPHKLAKVIFDTLYRGKP
jgi:2-phospho-L-lactate transferase/gluconeogenesis factor (CofD/UPF0052 family)